MMKITPYPLYKTTEELPIDYWDEKSQEHNNAYIWQINSVENKDNYYTEVDFGGGALDEINTDIVPFDLIKIELFSFDNNDLSLRKKHLKEIAHLRELLNEYFYDTLAFYPADKMRGFIDFERTVIIIPKAIYSEITKTIKDFNLSKYNDFIFYLIALIQRIFINEIEFYQQKEQQTELKKLPNQIENLIKVVDKKNEKGLIHERWDEKKGKNIYRFFNKSTNEFVECNKPSELIKIVFHFDNEKPIEINDFSMLSHIIGGIVNLGGRLIHYREEEEFLLWKQFMKSIPQHFNKNQLKKDQFKYAVTQSYLKFLTEKTKLKPEIDKRTSDRQIDFIFKILQFSHIEVKHIDGSLNDDINSAIDTVREWTKKPITR